HNRVLSAVIVHRWLNMTLSPANENVHTGLVSANYFSELGSSAAFGRLFLPGDAAPDAPAVVVLGYGLWQRRFGGDAAVVGTTIRLNQRPATIIGVAPFRFVGLNPEDGERNDLWLLVQQEPYFTPESKVLTSFDDKDSRIHMWGRLKPGVTRKSAEEALLPLARELVAQHPDILQKGEHLVATPGAYAARISMTDLPLLGLLSALVLVVLAAACGNLGSLLLGHAAGREREISIRVAVGASRGRIIRQLMTESMLLALLGSAAGLFLSWNASRAVVVFLGAPGNFDLTPDWRTVLFTFVIGVLACVLFGLPPARWLARQS